MKTQDKRIKRNNAWFIPAFVIAYVLGYVIALGAVGYCMKSVITEDVGWCEISR